MKAILKRRINERAERVTEEIRSTFAKDWSIALIEPVQFEVVADLKDFTFSRGGPKAWFAVLRRR